MDFTLTVSHRPDEELVELAGVLDYSSAPHLRRVVFEAFDDGVRDLSLDVAGLRLLDGAGINALTYLQRRAGERGVTLRVAAAGGLVQRTLEIAGVAKALRTHEELDWPEAERDRAAVDLHAVPPGHRHWPDDIAERLHHMHALAPDDPARARVRDEIIEHCLPATERIARRYGGAGESFPDLAQVAALALVKAVDGYDGTRGVEFGFYATPTIVGELKRHFRDRTAGIRLPRRLQELRLAMNRARDPLAQRLGRSPTAADLAADLGVDEEQILEVLGAAQKFRPLSLDGPAAGPEDGVTLADTIGDEDPGFDALDYHESLRVLLSQLPEREQRIVSLRFYGNLSQSDIADRVGLSQMHVSRLLRHALDFLRRRLSE
ncbi:SigB/SigF/SigG family RNA polymerase sigma factor [Dactylosporangium sp. NPDC051485]|uniref:SigB/SigF/SigG family RNA polymerase sigma factor n=1 Tax=Dactylosporangium sp. NPDC051485 TaxID=3154846 RepID=UPI0034218283